MLGDTKIFVTWQNLKFSTLKFITIEVKASNFPKSLPNLTIKHILIT